MAHASTIPTLAEFLAAPSQAVAAVAPATVIFAVGGTRRSAALAGLPPDSDAHVSRSRGLMLACFERFFTLGVRHLFTSTLRPGQLAEVGRYKERLLDWISWGLSGPESMTDYKRLGWRVRLVGCEQIPALAEVSARLVAETAETGPTLWFYGAPERSALWEQMLSAAAATGARTQGELIRALYHEEIPPAGVYIGFGKPLITNDIVPAALFEETQCYWTQRPGYELDDEMLRRIFYDYAYLRPTWVQDKSARYSEVSAHRELWTSQRILGLGTRIGGFWYPEHKTTEGGP